MYKMRVVKPPQKSLKMSEIDSGYSERDTEDKFKFVVASRNIFVGMYVKDVEGSIGKVINCDDPHMIQVEILRKGIRHYDTYCVVKGCYHYTPLMTDYEEEIDLPF